MMNINGDFNNTLSDFILPPQDEGSLEVIVKYVNDISIYSNGFMSIEILDNNFAIITGTPLQIRTLYTNPDIIFVELPKTLTYELSFSRSFVCATRAQNEPFSLTGKGVIVGIIDSGIDYTHPDFKDADGKSRILYIWDQTADGRAPDGFRSGAEYTKDMIDSALESDSPYSVLNFRDDIGHGTAVAGIACGNGNSSDGREKGIAPDSSIIAVKLGRRGNGAFPRTTEVMRAIKYTVDKAKSLGMPISVNLSFGTNNGSHDGNSLFEQYVNGAANEWKCVISAATGNEGSASHHYSAKIENGQTISIPFVVSNAPSKIYITIWKNFVDTIYFRLISPTGMQSAELIPTQSLYNFFLSDTNITVFYGQPTTYTQYQEVYILMESNDISIREGLWSLEAYGADTVDGIFDIWLPTLEDVTNDTAFSFPDTNVTLTLPSTVQNVISVGGYDQNTNTPAAFSGRGYTRNNVYAKPDVTAPAVNVLTTRRGGGYMSYTGTSMACPFVTGAAALLMEWGIVRSNDVFLYGQKVKAYIQKGARRTPNNVYPNQISGYGTLCISNSLDLLNNYRGGTVF